MRRHLLALALALGLGAAAQAQTITVPGMVTGGAGSLSSLAINGCTLGANVLCLTGVANATDSFVASNAVRAGTVLSLGSSNDVLLNRDAANALALRNGVNAQAFNVYNTYTDASNYERGVFDWTTNANALTIGTTFAGTGAARSVFINRGGSAKIVLASTGIQFGDHLLAATDNTYDIGASGANRPRNVYAAGFVLTGPKTVATLTACTSGLDGARAFVTDATAPAFGSAVAGAGAVHIPVYCDGSGTPTWKVG
jgi:hypothetical protein